VDVVACFLEKERKALFEGESAVVGADGDRSRAGRTGRRGVAFGERRHPAGVIENTGNDVAHEVPDLFFELDRLGQRGIGEVRPNFRCWAKWPAYQSPRKEFGAKRVDQLRDNLLAAQIRFSADELAALDEVSRLPSEYPGWMLERQGAYRAHMKA
jgi:hypothetical protein